MPKLVFHIILDKNAVITPEKRQIIEEEIDIFSEEGRLIFDSLANEMKKRLGTQASVLQSTSMQAKIEYLNDEYYNLVTLHKIDDYLYVYSIDTFFENIGTLEIPYTVWKIKLGGRVLDKLRKDVTEGLKRRLMKKASLNSSDLKIHYIGIIGEKEAKKDEMQNEKQGV